MRWLSGLLLIFLLGLQYRLWFGEGNLPEVWAVQRQIEQQQTDNSGLRLRNLELEAEVRDLNKGISAIEERARSELGMVKRGERFFLLPEKQ